VSLGQYIRQHETAYMYCYIKITVSTVRTKQYILVFSSKRFGLKDNHQFKHRNKRDACTKFVLNRDVENYQCARIVVCLSVSLSLSLYIYIYREREREREGQKQTVRRIELFCFDRIYRISNCLEAQWELIP